MTHADEGRYSAKHAPGKKMDEKIAAAVREKVENGEIACADAELIGAKIGTALAEVGRTLDLLEVRITRCQLGLFGYAAEGKSVRPAGQVTPEIEGAVRGHLAGGRLPCEAAWEIAAEMNIPRMKVSSACETLKIKIKPCQLGAF
jgi:actin-like ATPase involved in cell morphogenesis